MDQTNTKKTTHTIDIETVDAGKYQNVRVSDRISWFHALSAVCLAVSGIFIGIILCCWMILFVWAK